MRHGFLFIDKPVGPTSHDVVAQTRRVLAERSIGHLGTLDPAASGLLVLAIGAKALKVVELFSGLNKEYEADIRLGMESTTYDRDGVLEEVALKPGVEIPDEMAARRAIENHLLGAIRQVPPPHSAVHVNGVRAYTLAREGKEVNIPAREVEITKCEILSYQYPHMRVRVACSSGTYIRSLAHDLGKLLRCGGYLEGLRRTKVGEWKVEDAVTPEDIRWTAVHALKDILTPLEGLDLNAEDFEHVRCGRNIRAVVDENTIGWHEGLPVAVLMPVEKGMAHARKVF